MEVEGYKSTVPVQCRLNFSVDYEPSGYELESEQFWDAVRNMDSDSRQFIANQLKEKICREFQEFMEKRREDWGLTLANLIQDAYEAEEKDQQ